MTSGGLAAVSSSAFAALYSAFGKYDVVHIHAEGPAFFAWLPKMFGKRVVVTVHGIDWQREKWQSGLGSKFIHQGEKNAAKYADEVIVLSKGVQDYFKETYGRETHFIPNGVNRPQIREASLINILFPFATSIYVSRILLPAGVGKVASAQNIVSYFVTLAALGLPSYGVREFAKVREKKYERNKLFTELLLVNIISTTLAVVAQNAKGKLNGNVMKSYVTLYLKAREERKLIAKYTQEINKVKLQNGQS